MAEDMTVFICGAKAPNCSVLECHHPGREACCFVLRGRKEGEKCGRRLCAIHATKLSKVAPGALPIGGVLCPPHVQFIAARRRGARP